MREELEKKVRFAIRLLQMYGKGEQPLEIAYSGGKDSDVILQLAKDAGIKYRAIYKNTTIDPPGTIKHAKEMGAEVIQPKQTFFELIEKNGLPTRFSRFCCRYLKEYKVLDKSVIGVRRVESNRRAKRYTEPTECRLYGGKCNHVEAIYPILEWTNEDVAEFIAERGIQCHPLYYDEQGNFHVERRVGCLCCPLASRKKRIEQFKKYPGVLRQYVVRLRKYRESKKDIKVRKYFADEYEQMYFDLYCGKRTEFEALCNSIFGKPDFKSFLEQTFNINL